MPLLLLIVAFSAAGQIIYSEDFNANDGGFFRSGNSSFAWGEPTGDIGPGQAHSAPNAWATNLAGNYGSPESGFITSPVIDLSAHAGSQFVLSWWEHLDTEADFDFARVEAAIDGGVAFHTIYGEFSGPISTPGWTRRSAVLDASHAVANFRFRFHLRADDSETRAGYYIDDIALLVLPTSHIYAEDFESGDGGFAAVGSSSWALGAPSTGPAAAASGVNAWATNLDGFYGANETGHLLSPVIDASPAAGDPTGLLLSWQQFISTENTRDFASVEASVDGSSWISVYGPFSGPLGGPFHTWQREATILPPEFAVSTLQVRFRLSTDDSIANLGFYLDDVALSRTAATVPTASSFALSGTEDTPLPLAVADFANAFSASIATLRIESVPTHGDLILGDTIVNPGVELSPAQVDAIFYFPDTDYAGTDSFVWNATDGLFFSPETPAVTLTLANTNDPPTGLTISASTVAENSPGAVIGTLTATDPDGDDVHSFAVDDPRFAIAGDQLSVNSVLDHETEPTITLAITATDALGFASQQTLTITVTDVNEPPTFLTNNLAIDEGASHAFTPDDIASTDPEADPLTYTVLAVTHGQFLFGGSAVTEFQAGFINGAALRFEHDGSPNPPSYTLAVSDGSLAVTSTATVTFNATNDAPVLHSATFVISEGATAPLTPAGFSSSDEEDGPDALTYTVSAIFGGHFERVSGEIVTSFTQAEVNAFAIRFVDDDNETPPAFTVQVADSAGRSDGPKPGGVTYTSVNDPPEAIFLSNDSVPETPGATVASILVSDADDDTHSFTLSDPRFEVEGSTLKLTDDAAVDHETEPSISLSITATDPGGEALTRSVSIDITNANEAPTAITLDNAIVDENAAGASIGTLSVVDPDANSAHSFAIDDFRFEVDELELKLKPGHALDHEAGEIVVITITVTDNGFPAHSYSKNFSITVNDLNDTPQAVHIDVPTVDENDVGIVIGTLSVVDQDDGDSHSLAITDPRFAIAGKQLSLAPSVSLDHEATPTLDLAVSAADVAGAVLETSVTLIIRDRNEPPTGVSLSSTNLAESANAAVVGDIIIADPDADSAGQNIVTVDDPRFTIVGSSLRLADGIQVDHESEQSIDIVLTVTDSGNNSFTASSAITLTVLDLNEAPTQVLLTNRFIDENVTGLLGNLSALDPDDGDSHTFSVDDARFAITDNQLSLLTPINHEASPSIPITLTATDSGGLTRDAPIAIIIENVNEAPTVIALNATAVVENFPNATIGAVTVSDPDNADSHSFSLSDGRFAITDGELHLTAPLDHENDDPTPLTITATDAQGLANSATFSITVIDAPDAPVAVFADNLEIPENAPGAIVGTLSVLDDDALDSHTLAVDDARFEIVNGSTLRLRSDVVFDHETDPAIPIQVTATDSTDLSFAQPLTVLILDLNEPPTNITLANSAIAENTTGAIGAIDVDDQDHGATHNFTLSDPRFAVVDGQLQLLTPIDHESEPLITLSVTATDAAGAVSRVFGIVIGDVDEPPTGILLSSAEIAENNTGIVGTVSLVDPDEPLEFRQVPVLTNPLFSIAEDSLLLLQAQDHESTPSLALDISGFSVTIAITDRNEAPSALALSATIIPENSVAGLIGTLTVSDPDAGDSHSITVDDSRFAILGATLRLADNIALDHETDPSVDLVFTTTDAGGLSRTDSFTIAVADIDEPPTAITVSPATIAENSSGLIGQITVTDPDAIAPIVLTDPRFSIIDGALHLLVAQDHETTPSITINLSGFSTVITIANVDEPPTAVTLSSAEIAENSSGFIGTITFEDPDDPPTLQLPAPFGIVDGALHLLTPQNHETTPSLAVDIAGFPFTITIVDVDEPPTAVTLSSAEIAENATGFVGGLSFEDPDEPAAFRQPPPLAAPFAIIDDALHLISAQDHETTPSLPVDIAGFAFAITILDVDEPPTSITLTHAAIAENSAGLIGQIIIDDPDSIAPVVLDDARFSIVDNALHLAIPQNHETTPTLTVSLSGFSIPITITDVDEPPTAIVLSATEIAENSTGLIGQITVTDPDQAPAFRLAPTVADPQFSIQQDSLSLLVPADHESTPTIPFVISSGGFSQSFTLTVANRNEPATAIVLDNASIPENSSGAIGALSVFDPDAGDSHSLFVSDSRFVVINGVLRAATDFDHELTPNLPIDITATDAAGVVFTQTLSISITNVNEAPSALSLSSTQVGENQTGASIGTLTITDPDADDSHSVSSSDPRFAVTDGTLHLSPGVTLDFEAAAAIPLTLTATDAGGLARARSFTLIVIDSNDSPSIPTLSASSVAESANAVEIGVLAASDQDGDSITFATDDPRFVVIEDRLRLAAGGLDFETEPSIPLRITATDTQGAASTASFSISITDINEAPTGLSLSGTQVAENAVAAVIGDISVTDPDTGATHLLAVDDARFEVIGVSLKLKGGLALDHESEPSVSLTITATDAADPSLKIEVPVTITVNDIDEPPTAISLNFAEIAENSTGVVGGISIDDPDATSSVTVSDPRFSVSEDLVLLTPLNHELTPEVSLTITADGLTRGFSIVITDVPEAPTSLTLTPLGLPENADNIFVAEIAASDDDADDTVDFSVDDPRFQVSGDLLRLRSGHVFDFETTNSVSITLTATDSEDLSRSESFTLDVTDVNEAPTAISLASTTVPENDASASLGAITVEDPDTNASHFFSVSDPRFDVTNGILSLEVALDRESEPTVPLTITATDTGGLQHSQNFSITVSDVNEPPTAISVAPASIAENATGSVGVVSVTDPDAIDPVVVSDPRFQVIDGHLHLVEAQNHEAIPSITLALSGFSIAVQITDVDEPPTAITVSPATIAEGSTGSVGTITVTDPDAVAPVSVTDPRFQIINDQLHLVVAQDFESTPSLSVELSGFTVGVAITNVNEAPTAVTLDATTLAENTLADIGSVAVADPDSNDSHILTVDDARFEIIGGLLRNRQPLDHEVEPTVPIRITATDAAGLAKSADFTLTVGDVDEPPTAITLSAAEIAENSTGLIGSISVTDPDDVAPVVLTDPRFQIIGDQLHLVQAQDHETTPSITVDLSGFSSVITITNVDEPTTAISVAPARIVENSTGSVGVITVTDPDDVPPLVVDDARFQIIGDELHLIESLNYEFTPTIDLNISGFPVRVVIIDVNEAPGVISLDSSSILENATGVVGAISVSDPDAGAAHLLTADDARFEILNGQLRLLEPFDHETTPSLNISITATDLADGSLSLSSNFTITIADVDEPPTAITVAPAEIAENSSGVIGTISISDPDAIAPIALSDSRFQIIDDQLHLVHPQDHEATPIITVALSGFDIDIAITDVNEPATGISLGFAEIAENSTGFVGAITVTDPDATPAPPSASAPFAVIDGGLHLLAAQDHETTPTLDLTLIADGISEDFIITIVDRNEPPTALGLSNASIAENSIGLIGNLSATDEDENDSHSYTVADPRFGIDGAELRLLAPLDHETTPTLDVVVSAQGYSETFTLTVTDVGEPPTAIALSNTSIDEHTSGLVGTLSVSDPDEGDSHSFTLDDTHFAIDGNELRLISPLNHEAIASIDIAISTQGFTQPFTIIIADVNEPPTGVFLSGSSITENSTGRVGDITVVDPDIGDSHVFSSSDPRFAVVDGELRLLAGIDHETTPHLSLTLTTQGVATSFNISIVDVDEPPTAITLSNAEIAENSSGFLGSLSVVDPDGGSSAFTVDDDRFTLFGNILVLLEGVDHETEPVVQLDVTVQGYTETLAITITDVDELPTDITVVVAEIAENSTGVIGTVTVHDPDDTAPTAVASAPFSIVDGALHLDEAQDHETTPTLEVTLSAGGFSKAIDITIVDVNEPPTAITVAPAAIDENSTGLIGAITITDPDAVDPITLDDGRFQVIDNALHLVQAQDHEATPTLSLDLDGFSTTITIRDVDDPPTAIALDFAEIAENSTGVVGAITITDQDATTTVTVDDVRFSVGEDLALLQPIDRETEPTVPLVITADGVSQSVTVTISNVDEPATAITLSNSSIDENSTGFVGTISVTDPDDVAPVVLSDPRFQIIGDSLHLVVPQNHETTPSITLDLSGFSTTVTIADVNEAPAFVNNTLAIDEGATVVLGADDLLASDPDGDALTFTPIAQAHGSFSPVSFTAAQVAAGAVSFTHDASQNPPAYSLAVSDGALSVSSTATVFFNDANDRPVLLEASLTISEGGSADPVLRASDEEDDNATLSFTISELSGGSYVAPTFTHDGGEAAPAFSVTVTDSGGRSMGPIPATITFTNVDDPPSAISVAPATISENATGSVGTITIVDLDGVTAPVPSDGRFQVIGDQLHLIAAQDHESTPEITLALDGFDVTVTISNVDEPPTAIALETAEIAENSIGVVGAVTISDPDSTTTVSVDDPRFSVGEDLVLLQPLDHESEPTVALVITADGVSQSVTVTVTDVDEPPTAIQLSNSSIAENTTGFVGTISVIDPDAAPVQGAATLTVSDPRFTIVDEALHLAIAQDHETTPSISFAITADGYSQSFTVTITNVDEPPTAISVAPASIAENSTGSIGIITVTDPDTVAPVTVSDPRFQVIDGHLHLLAPQDHETTPSLSVDLSGFTIDVAITDLNEAPTAIALSNAEIAENGIGLVGVISLTDPDAPSPVTIADDRFAIVDDQLHLVVAQDRETTPNIPITLSSNGFEQAFTITIGNIDEPPTAISVAPASILENSTGSVGTISITDPDSLPVVVASDPRFEVIGDQLHLIAAQDHEASPSITLDLNGFSITVLIGDANEPPTSLVLASATIPENSSGAIGAISLTDPDALDPVTVDDARFAVIDGVLHLSQPLDHETTPTVPIVLSSGGFDQAYTIFIADVNEPPTSLTLSVAEFAENSTGPVATVLYTDLDEISPATVDDPRFAIIDAVLHLLVAQDHETTPSIPIMLSSNGFEADFSIVITDINEPPTAIALDSAEITENSVGVVGALSITDVDATDEVAVDDPRFSVGEDLVLLTPLDHETTPTIPLVITADGVSQSVTISVTNVDEPPTAIALSNAEIAENSTGLVGIITITDPDAISPPVPNDARFQVIGDQLHLVFPQDRETTPEIALELDGFAFSIVITNVDEPPTAIGLANASVPENATGALIGDIIVTDPDAAPPATLVDPRFQVANGQLRLAPGVALDHETTPTVPLTISAGGFSQALTVTVSDVNEPASGMTLSTTEFAENTTGFIATIAISDPEGDAHTPTVSDPSFTVIGDQLHALLPFDHEATPTQSLDISGFTVSLVILDLDEPPTAITVAPASIAENSTGLIGAITVTDPDAIAPVLLSDPRFQIIDDALHLVQAQDHETTPSVSVDLSGFVISIAITNVDEPPTAIALDKLSLDENAPGAIVGALSISDPDATGPAAVSDARFTIANGQLRLRAGVALDHETDPSIALDISADGFTQAFTIDVRDINEPPTAIALAVAEIAENTTGPVGAVSITDVDATDLLSVDDPRFSVGEDLVLLQPLDHEASPTIPVVISADGFSQAFTIRILDVDEPPTAITLDFAEIAENSTGHIGAILVEDPDARAPVALADPRFQIIGDALQLIQPQNHETTPSISVDLSGFTQTITITNVNEPPTLTLADASVPENQPGALLGPITVSDPDAADSHNFAFDDPRFDIQDGLLVALSGFDHETAASLTLQLTVTDALGLADSATVTITVLDENERPISMSLPNSEFAENGVGLIGAIDIDDPDAGDSHSFAIDDPRFELQNGELRNLVAFDHETTPSTTITVTATDSGGLSISQAFALTITNVDEPPTAITLSNAEIAENTTGLIGAINVTDPDALAPILLTDPRFQIIDNALHLVEAQDHELTPNIVVDLSGFSITIAISNVDEPPTAIALSNTSIDENSPGAIVGDLQVSDPDGFGPATVDDVRFSIANGQLRAQALDHETTPSLSLAITIDGVSQSFTITVGDRNEAPVLSISANPIAENQACGLPEVQINLGFEFYGY